MGSDGFRQPVHLTTADEPRHRVRCPIHGFIRFSDNERRLIDHPLFRRLRWIRQLALTELVYPGATHTRFEHSLGVMDVATRMFDTLARGRGDLMERTFGTVAGLRDAPLAKARQLVRLAGLLHDIGHCCFSHAAETVIQKGADHEGLSVQLLQGADFFGAVLDGLYFGGAGEWVAKVIGGTKLGLPPQLQVLKDIVSGQVDADRTDYLLRDSHHCGVDYGRFDHRRMIECLTLREDPEGTGGLQIALQRDGLHTFEALILARYQMNAQVYYHRLRRIYDQYLQEYFRAVGEAAFDTPAKVLEHTDVSAMAGIIAAAADPSRPGHAWAQRIRDRRHHREVFATDPDVGADRMGGLKRAFERLKGEEPDADLRFDEAEVGIHKLLLPTDGEPAGLVQFPVIERDGAASSLGRRSHILRTTPRWFRVVRVYADERATDRAARAELARKYQQYAAF